MAALPKNTLILRREGYPGRFVPFPLHAAEWLAGGLLLPGKREVGSFLYCI